MDHVAPWLEQGVTRSAADYRIVPSAQIEMLPGLGHSPMIEDPRRTADLLLAFTTIHAARAD
ncbi:alpha/beta fold hydrolase [Sphaerisporangium dianthi]|uniref:Alpha/beta fold hydrolase n=1 Tax=Sphaerisporangium dianthi TaxID=1436120 RepID=A0ABV9CLT4_9ACTN